MREAAAAPRPVLAVSVRTGPALRALRAVRAVRVIRAIRAVRAICAVRAPRARVPVGAAGALRMGLAAAGVLAYAAAPSALAAAGGAHAPEEPRLVVLVTIDQLRGDLLERYAPALRGGLARVRREGAVFTGATVDHAPTNSYPGHTTIATGAHPRRHGLIDNSWAEKTDDGWIPVGGVHDPAHPVVGVADPAKLPGASPLRLQTTALADWWKAADPGARVVHVSTGEYAALLQAGKGKADGHTYWYSPAAGRYVTTSFYRDALPPFVTQINDGVLAPLLARAAWPLEVPRRHRALALPDDAPGEYFGMHGTFPHTCAAECAAEELTPAQWAYGTPLIDEVTIELARAAVRELGLGKSESGRGEGRGGAGGSGSGSRRAGRVDYLNVALGGTDSVGHWYGPRSLEQLDTILRIDRALETFFRDLDRAAGRGRWIVAVVADHGSSDIPPPERRITGEMVEALFTRLAELPSDADPAATRADAARIVEETPFVARVLHHEDLAAPAAGDETARLYGNSFHPRRVPRYPLVSSKGSLARFQLLPVLEEGWVTPYAPANHGTPHPYDRDVTLMFMGPGVPARRIEGGGIADVAPTLAALAGVRPLDPLDGRALFAPAPAGSAPRGEPAGA